MLKSCAQDFQGRYNPLARARKDSCAQVNMGGSLKKPVESIAVKRHSGEMFRVGIAEMNGWRSKMEDAHVIVSKDTWGFFGIFDGHGGTECSKFIARRMTEEISKGPPESDKAMRSLRCSWTKSS